VWCGAETGGVNLSVLSVHARRIATVADRLRPPRLSALCVQPRGRFQHHVRSAPTRKMVLLIHVVQRE